MEGFNAKKVYSNPLLLWSLTKTAKPYLKHKECGRLIKEIDVYIKRVNAEEDHEVTIGKDFEWLKYRDCQCD